MPEDIPTYTQDEVDEIRRCAMATGYIYGRQDQREDNERGPLIYADEFELAALQRDTLGCGLRALYEELAAAKTTRNPAPRRRNRR